MCTTLPFSCKCVRGWVSLSIETLIYVGWESRDDFYDKIKVNRFVSKLFILKRAWTHGSKCVVLMDLSNDGLIYPSESFSKREQLFSTVAGWGLFRGTSTYIGRKPLDIIKFIYLQFYLSTNCNILMVILYVSIS